MISGKHLPNNAHTDANTTALDNEITFDGQQLSQVICQSMGEKNFVTTKTNKPQMESEYMRCCLLQHQDISQVGPRQIWRDKQFLKMACVKCKDMVAAEIWKLGHPLLKKDRMHDAGPADG